MEILIDENVIEHLRVAVRHERIMLAGYDLLGGDVNVIGIDEVWAGEHNLIDGRGRAFDGAHHVNVAVVEFKGTEIADDDDVGVRLRLFRLQQGRQKLCLSAALGANLRAIVRIVYATQRKQMSDE